MHQQTEDVPFLLSQIYNIDLVEATWSPQLSVTDAFTLEFSAR